MYIFLIIPFFLVIFLSNTVKYVIILWGKYQEERRQENKKELKKYVLLVVLFVVLCGVDYSLYQHYLDYTKIVSYTKNSFTKEETDILSDVFCLPLSNKYEISYARYREWKDVSIYFHVAEDDIQDFIKTVCECPEEKMEYELAGLEHLDNKESEYVYTNLFDETVVYTSVYVDGKRRYIENYIWKEKDGYGVEMLRNAEDFYSEVEIEDLEQLFSTGLCIY